MQILNYYCATQGDVSSILYNADGIDQNFRSVENKILASIIGKIPTQQYFQDNTN